MWSVWFFQFFFCSDSLVRCELSVNAKNSDGFCNFLSCCLPFLASLPHSSSSPLSFSAPFNNKLFPNAFSPNKIHHWKNTSWHLKTSANWTEVMARVSTISARTHLSEFLHFRLKEPDDRGCNFPSFFASSVQVNKPSRSRPEIRLLIGFFCTRWSVCCVCCSWAPSPCRKSSVSSYMAKQIFGSCIRPVRQHTSTFGSFASSPEFRPDFFYGCGYTWLHVK